MLQWPDGRIRPLLFDGSPLLSSAVLFGADGTLHTGRDAAHLGRGNPERLEPNPKRRIDDDVVLLGPAEVPVRDLLGAVLVRVAQEAGRVAGRFGELTITHPAAWGARRCALLVEAAERAGLGRPRLVPEPVAAATYFAHTMSGSVPVGSRVVVYDLGAGTCDVTVLLRRPHGFDVIASDGLNDVGGLDVDAAIVAFLEATYGTLWTDAVTRRQVWDEVRNAKEMLSRTSGTVIAIPALGREAPLGREQFDGLIGPVLRPTVALTRSLIRDTGTGPAAVVLVGGASRIPLVATMLTEATGVPPIVIEQPELVVAEGALHLPPAGGTSHTGGASHAGAAQVAAGNPVSAPPTGPVSGPPSGPVSGPLSGPVSGGMSGPVPTAWGGPAAPVSGAFGPAAPVSGVSGPAGPVSGAFGPAPFGPAPFGGAAPPGTAPPGTGSPGMTPPGRPGEPRRGSLALVLSIVAVVLVVLASGVAGVVYVVNKDDGKPGANPTTPTGGTGQPTPASGGSARYDATKLPENLCLSVDLGRLATQFDTQATAPTVNRQLSTIVSTMTCTISRQKGTAAVMSLLMIVTVYTDPKLAVDQQKLGLDNAKLNDPGTKTLDGIGDEAYATRTGGVQAATTVALTLEMRAANMRWSAYLTASKISSAGWTDQERAQFVTDLGAAVKASHAKFTA
ncbi:hypothetical protein Vau01_030810 [Virgisporangium aurantiacum]|uniref:Hsp70 protein n=2 Tax=Virgisporangium aurantiacum TaxID=175570 RepID=A0A8J3Z610_9ACTN|nr:hypothetical protein Vau01_030810 [Virgisporangium aurantiacum]